MAEPSSLRLARALEKAGLAELAARARQDEFHDFRSPHVLPTTTLIGELRMAGERGRGIIEQTMQGDFDADKAESERWLRSDEGQTALRELEED